MGKEINNKILRVLGIIAIIAALVLIYVSQTSMKPADVRIVEILEENRGRLLGLVGVVGAGIARDENNRIIGIAIYVDDAVSEEALPNQLGEFEIYIKRFYEESDLEKEKMIIRNDYFRLLKVTVDKDAYQADETLTIIVQNLSNETLTFGNSVYGAYFEKWDGKKWMFHTGIVGLLVITNLNPGEEGRITYKLDASLFDPGKYRVVSIGWIENEDGIIRVWGYIEFTVFRERK